MTPHIMTFTGKLVNPLDVKTEELDIVDIAHALSNINRFNGHVRLPINVAQHSVFVAQLVSKPHRKQALLHDASEAYLGDITKWLKAAPEFAAYREAEDRLQRLIFRTFGCAEELASEVEDADVLMVRHEAEQGFGNLWRPPSDKYGLVTELERKRIGFWTPWGHSSSEARFLMRWTTLTREQRRLSERPDEAQG